MGNTNKNRLVYISGDLGFPMRTIPLFYWLNISGVTSYFTYHVVRCFRGRMCHERCYSNVPWLSSIHMVASASKDALQHGTRYQAILDMELIIMLFLLENPRSPESGQRLLKLTDLLLFISVCLWDCQHNRPSYQYTALKARC